MVKRNGGAQILCCSVPRSCLSLTIVHRTPPPPAAVHCLPKHLILPQKRFHADTNAAYMTRLLTTTPSSFPSCPLAARADRVHDWRRTARVSTAASASTTEPAALAVASGPRYQALCVSSWQVVALYCSQGRFHWGLKCQRPGR